MSIIWKNAKMDMDIYGHLWTFMDIYGHLWTCHPPPLIL